MRHLPSTSNVRARRGDRLKGARHKSSGRHCQAGSPTNSPFCPTALCGPRTFCDERRRACIPLGPFCPGVACPPYMVCDEEARSCVRVPFCPTAMCPPDTVCDDDALRCVPLTDEES